jgi:hypothetical protein
MLYGHIAVAHQQLVPDHALLVIDRTVTAMITAMGPPQAPPAPAPATPSSTR